MDANELFDKVLSLLRKHHEWFNDSIPLIASENIPSPAVREAITSDFGNRYAEGWPGERVYAGCTYIDQVEIICNDLAKRVFGAEFADCRATSGVVANLAIYSAFSYSGDYMIAASYPLAVIFHMARKNILVPRFGTWIEYRTLSFLKGRNDHRCRCNEEKDQRNV